MFMKLFDAFRIAAASTIIVGAVAGVVIWSLVYGYNQHGWMGVAYAAAALHFIVVFFRTLLEKF